MDWYIATVTIMLVSLLELLVIGWVYGEYDAQVIITRNYIEEIMFYVCSVGGARLYDDIEVMIGYKPFILWRYMWQIVTPFIVAVSIYLTLCCQIDILDS